MKTQVLSAITQKENGVRSAARIIESGGLVAFPTETVYGLGANGLDGQAVARIFEAKGRPMDNPLILHIAKKSDVKRLWSRVPPEAHQLMDAFWPGPLTLVFIKNDCVPQEVTADLDTVGVRMPANKTALALIRAAQRPIAAPSANLSGRPSPTCAAHVLEDMDGRIDLILDGGPCAVGVESTVLSLVGQPAILRPGGVTREMLEAVIGPVDIAKAVLQPLGEREAAASPGMKYRHYAPEAEVIIAQGGPRQAAAKICRAYDEAITSNIRPVIFATIQTHSFYRDRNYVIIGDRNAPETLCANLFGALREHSAGADIILTEALPEDAMGLAYMNRLLRASGFHTI